MNEWKNAGVKRGWKKELCGLWNEWIVGVYGGNDWWEWMNEYISGGNK